MAAAIARHYELLDAAIAGSRRRATGRAGRGRQRRRRVRPRAPTRCAAALDAQRACRPRPGRRGRRSGAHGDPHRRGPAPRRGQLLRPRRSSDAPGCASIAHGGQVLVSSATADLVVDRPSAPTSTLVDLGMHRLKDLARPEHVWQLVHPRPRAGLPAAALARHASRTTCPSPLTTFIGRRRDRHRSSASCSTTAWSTSPGPGGAGKTRLAQQVGAELVEAFPDGVWWVDLVGVQDPTLVAVGHQPGRAARRGPRRPPRRDGTAPGRTAGAAHPRQLRAPARRVRRGGRGAPAPLSRRAACSPRAERR